jgi:hypothetical protein
MELVSKKILLETFISRNESSYGVMTAETIDVNVFLTQKFDDMGYFTDTPFVPNDTILSVPPPEFNGMVRLTGITVDMFYNTPNTITGTTDDSNLYKVKSYKVDINNQPIYTPFLNMSDDITLTFDGTIAVNSNEVDYVVGGDPNNIPNTGVHFNTQLNDYVEFENNGDIKRFRKTNFNVISSGRTEFNTTLSANTKHEEFLGIVFKQEIKNDVFIDRGGEDVFEKHMVMAEIKSVNDIDEYRNGYLINNR